MTFAQLPKLKKGDSVAILSPSFAAPGVWPHVYELGLKRLIEDFGLHPVEFPTTKKVGASAEERMADIVDAFKHPDIKGIITTLGGNDQVTYVKNLPKDVFQDNPKPCFGFSDNSHLLNHLWLCGVPSYYGGALFTQFAMQSRMDELTVTYLRHALFESETVELTASTAFTDIGLNWDDPDSLNQSRTYEDNTGWVWDAAQGGTGISWGGCLESIDEMFRHNVPIPTLEQFEGIMLLTETSEEVPSHEYVHRVYRAFGERGILERIRGVLVGRPKTWNFDTPYGTQERTDITRRQQETIIRTVREYNKNIPIVLNLDFGHTDPQICMPYGGEIHIDSSTKKITAAF